MEDQLITKTQVRLDFIDRLRVLFGAILEVEVKIKVRVKVSDYNGTSNVKLIGRSSYSFQQDKPMYGYISPPELKD
jgi:hypothetical protein